MSIEEKVSSSSSIKLDKEKKIKNWSSYNEGLVQRGSLEIWLTQETKHGWYVEEKRKGKGKRKVYSDEVIRLMFALRNVYHLSYRQTEGFLRSIIEQEGIEKLRIPDYTLMSKRGKDKGLEEELRKAKILRGKGEKIHIAIDSTGIKIYGESEWKAKHAKERKDKWIKLHAGIEVGSRQVVTYCVTKGRASDGEQFVRLMRVLEQQGIDIEKMYGDGAYSWEEIFAYLEKRGIEAGIPLPKNAVLSGERSREAFKATARDKALIAVEEAGGIAEWKKKSGYHQRSLIENFFYRLKTILGEKLKSRISQIQQLEVSIRMMILNKFALLGLPKYN